MFPRNSINSGFTRGAEHSPGFGRLIQECMECLRRIQNCLSALNTGGENQKPSKQGPDLKP